MLILSADRPASLAPDRCWKSMIRGRSGLLGRRLGGFDRLPVGQRVTRDRTPVYARAHGSFPTARVDPLPGRRRSLPRPCATAGGRGAQRARQMSLPCRCSTTWASRRSPPTSTGSRTASSDAVRADDRFLGEVAGHLLAAGGKRLRPTLTLCAAYAAAGARRAGDRRRSSPAAPRSSWCTSARSTTTT